MYKMVHVWVQIQVLNYLPPPTIHKQGIKSNIKNSTEVTAYPNSFNTSLSTCNLAVGHSRIHVTFYKYLSTVQGFH